MKRFVTIALALALLLTACGGKEGGEVVDYNQYLRCDTHVIGEAAYYIIHSNNSKFSKKREIPKMLWVIVKRNMNVNKRTQPDRLTVCACYERRCGRCNYL